MPRADMEVLLSLKIPYPSKDEQRRIVDVLSCAEGIVRLRRDAHRKVQKLLPALFLHVFGDPTTNPKGWNVATLGELTTEGPQNGIYKPSSFYGDGTPILRIDAFYDGRVKDLASLKRVRLKSEERAKYRLRPRDIVINRVNSVEYLGKSTIIPPLSEEIVFESNMMRFSVNEERVLPEYVIELLQTGLAKAHILANAKHAINQSSINQQDVKAFTVPLPPRDLQLEFTRRVDEIRSIEVQQALATRKAVETFDALLARSFGANGEASHGG